MKESSDRPALSTLLCLLVWELAGASLRVRGVRLCTLVRWTTPRHAICSLPLWAP